MKTWTVGLVSSLHLFVCIHLLPLLLPPVSYRCLLGLYEIFWPGSFTEHIIRKHWTVTTWGPFSYLFRGGWGEGGEACKTSSWPEYHSRLRCPMVHLDKRGERRAAEWINGLIDGMGAELRLVSISSVFYRQVWGSVSPNNTWVLK